MKNHHRVGGTINRAGRRAAVLDRKKKERKKSSRGKKGERKQKTLAFSRAFRTHRGRELTPPIRRPRGKRDLGGPLVRPSSRYDCPRTLPLGTFTSPLCGVEEEKKERRNYQSQNDSPPITSKKPETPDYPQGGIILLERPSLTILITMKTKKGGEEENL